MFLDELPVVLVGFLVVALVELRAELSRSSTRLVSGWGVSETLRVDKKRGHTHIWEVFDSAPYFPSLALPWCPDRGQASSLAVLWA